MYIYFEYQYLEALCGIISNILDVCKSTPAENSLSHTHTNSLSVSLSPSLQSQHVVPASSIIWSQKRSCPQSSQCVHRWWSWGVLQDGPCLMGFWNKDFRKGEKEKREKKQWLLIVGAGDFVGGTFALVSGFQLAQHKRGKCHFFSAAGWVSVGLPSRLDRVFTHRIRGFLVSWPRFFL